MTIQLKFTTGVGHCRWRHRATTSLVRGFMLLTLPFPSKSQESRLFFLRVHSWSPYHATCFKSSGHRIGRTSQLSNKLSFFHTGAQVRHHYLLSLSTLILPLEGACFVCEVLNKARVDLDGQADCPRCGPSVKLDWKHTQCILEHMGAHIQFDATLNTSEEYCGLCLCVSLMCKIYLTKGRGDTLNHLQAV